MTDGQTKKVIVVLSAGRSGTSLLMNALGHLGMSLSENLIPAKLENPEGYFEDAEIVRIHNQLLSDLRTCPTLPLPDDWLDSSAARKTREQLVSVVTRRLEHARTIWGFKDPRICSFLPLWTGVFNIANVVPSFVLAVRNPASVAASLQRQINRKESITELQWLLRTCDALHHTAADCFVVHYEEWFTHPTDLTRGLLQYTGLSDHSGTVDAREALKSLVKPNLNRAQYEDYSVKNQWVAKLYAQLLQCRGSNFDRDALMEVVKECRRVIEQFKGWAYTASHQMQTDSKQLEEAVSENSRLLQQVKDLFEEVNNLRRQTTPARGTACAHESTGRVELESSATIRRNAFLSKWNTLILAAKRRVAEGLPGFYRYYRARAK